MVVARGIDSKVRPVVRRDTYLCPVSFLMAHDPCPMAPGVRIIYAVPARQAGGRRRRKMRLPASKFVQTSRGARPRPIDPPTQSRAYITSTAALEEARTRKST